MGHVPNIIYKTGDKSHIIEAKVGVGGNSGMIENGLDSVPQVGSSSVGEALQLHAKHLLSED